VDFAAEDSKALDEIKDALKGKGLGRDFQV
jgi:hypothetical protein